MKKYLLAIVAILFATPAFACSQDLDKITLNLYGVEYSKGSHEIVIYHEPCKNYTKNIPVSVSKDGTVSLEYHQTDIWNAYNYNKGYEVGDKNLVDWIKDNADGLKPSALVKKYHSQKNQIQDLLQSGSQTGYYCQDTPNDGIQCLTVDALFDKAFGDN